MSEWELLRGSVGPQIEEQGELASGTRAWRPRGSKHAARSALFIKFQISNSTSNIPLKPILRTSLTPKPRRVGKNSTNKSCTSTYQLQLLFRGFCLNLNSSRVISTQSAARETVTRS